jgi:hypothetical protein
MLLRSALVLATFIRLRLCEVLYQINSAITPAPKYAVMAAGPKRFTIAHIFSALIPLCDWIQPYSCGKKDAIDRAAPTTI